MQEDHPHPSCVIMAGQLLANLEWTMASITDGLQEDNSEKCVVERIQGNLAELSKLRIEIEVSKQEWLRKLKVLASEQCDLLRTMKTL
jgi:hypothetical protein